MIDWYCPVCGETEGWHIDHGFCDEDGMKIEPDMCYCNHCGFTYSEHVNHSIDEKASQYKKQMISGTEKHNRV